MIEIVKNVAAVLGVILSGASVITLFSKTAREWVSGIIRKYGGQSDLEIKVDNLTSMLEKHIEEDQEFKTHMKDMNEITLEFTKNQCRNNIKNTFYQYRDTKVLPLYEKKNLMCIEELYIGKLKCNTFAKLLLEEMDGWSVDYDQVDGKEQD